MWKGEPLRTVFMYVSEKRLEGKWRGITNHRCAPGSRDGCKPGGNAGEGWGGEPWLVLVLFVLIMVLCKKKETARMIGKI